MNQKAQSSLTKTIVSLIVSFVLIGSIFSGCTSSYRAAKQQSEKVQDKSYILNDINKVLTDLASGNGIYLKTVMDQGWKTDDWIKELESAKYGSSSNIQTLSKGEFILFFSSGNKDILLTQNAKNITFKRPQVNECYDRACTCYVKNLNLWYVETSSNELQLKLYLDKIENGIDLGSDVKCVAVPNTNTNFLSSSGYIKHFKYPIINNIKSQVIVPLSIISTKYFNVLDPIKEQTYFFNQFNVNTLRDINHLATLLNLKWENGVVIGDFYSSNKHSVESLIPYPEIVTINLIKLNTSSLKYPLQYNDAIVVSLLWHLPPFTQTQLDDLNKQYEMQILKENNPFKPNVQIYETCPECSEIKATISTFLANSETNLQAKTNIKLSFLEFMEKLFLKSELNDQLNLKFIKSGEKTNIDFLIKDSTTPFSVESDVSFIFPNEMNEVCFENIDEWTGELIECSSKNKYSVEIQDDGSIYFNKISES
jgi:hypothetical protein